MKKELTKITKVVGMVHLLALLSLLSVLIYVLIAFIPVIKGLYFGYILLLVSIIISLPIIILSISFIINFIKYIKLLKHEIPLGIAIFNVTISTLIFLGGLFYYKYHKIFETSMLWGYAFITIIYSILLIIDKIRTRNNDDMEGV
jgi:hypothetical protein